MSSRIIVNGRVLLGGRYGTAAKCMCGAEVEILGCCAPCHEALVRRRRGLPPKTEQERERLARFMASAAAETARAEQELEEGGPIIHLDDDDAIAGWMHLRR